MVERSRATKRSPGRGAGRADGDIAATRDRLLDAAMERFAHDGYDGTSVASIEADAGLRPGSGGLYHHFASKEALLVAGVARQLEQLDAVADVRRLFSGLGDPRAELVVAARTLLSQLDAQAVLVRLLASEARRRPELLAAVTERLLSTTYDTFVAWLAEVTGDPPGDDRARARAVLAVTTLVGHRLVGGILGVDPLLTDDDAVAAWVDMVLAGRDLPS